MNYRVTITSMTGSKFATTVRAASEAEADRLGRNEWHSIFNDALPVGSFSNGNRKPVEILRVVVE